MSQRAVRVRSRRRRGMFAITAVVMFMALGAGAASAQATSFKITNMTDPAGDATPFTYHVTFAPQPGDNLPADFKPPADFTLTGGQSRTFTVHKGFYTITQLGVQGWQLANITCDNGGDTVAADAPKINVAGSNATLELSSTENKGCTFANAKVPGAAPATPPATGSPAPPAAQNQAPAQGVRGTRVVRAVASLAAPQRCVSRRYTVSVAAGRVRSVAFFVNGKRVRTLAARPGQRRFSVQLPKPKPTSIVVAKVQFRANTSPATRTLRATIRRCAQQAVQPQFTG
jgi:hypothetical protein